MTNDTTSLVREKYNQMARNYDRMMSPVERLIAGWRKRLCSQATGLVLEVGCGTGANFRYYPEGVLITAIDFSPRMLEIASSRATRLHLPVELKLADIQDLPFQNSTFDTIIVACVFCSVPDPIQGLQELGRVVKPGGRLYLLEHVRSNGPILGFLMDWLNPWVVSRSGENINRNTEANILQAGLDILGVENLFWDVFKLITAVPVGMDFG